MRTAAARLAHLKSHGTRLAGRELKTLLVEDPARAQRMALRVDGLYANFARQRVDAEAFAALLAMAEDADTTRAFRALLEGEAVNRSEGRPALHTALRTALDAPVAAQAAADVVAAQVGEAHVQHYQIVAVALQQRQGFATQGAAVNREAVGLEGIGEGVGNGRFVVDDEDFHGCDS